MRVLPIGCVTKGRAGKLLAELGELADAGCIGFSDDGSPVGDAAIMRRALEYASAFDLPIIDHCEDPQLAGGVMHEGWVSTRLGLKGIPAASEESMVARDLALARQTGAHVHIAHLSTAGGVELVRRGEGGGRARHRRGDAAPPGADPRGRHAPRPARRPLAYDTNAKMYPPLRRAGGRRRLHRGAARRHDRRRSRPTTRRTPCRRSSASSTTRPSASSAWRRRSALCDDARSTPAR